jgi:FlaA1/EpsC-like NDP-sugar epimerase
MKRFFMSIEEAVSLVIQAGAYTQGGDLFVLDMGEEVSIEQLARKMIRLRGLRAGKDIAIEYTGVRPGEKLSEVLHCPIYEALEPACSALLLRVDNHTHLPWKELLANVDDMIRLADQADRHELTQLLFEISHFLCPQDCSVYASQRPRTQELPVTTCEPAERVGQIELALTDPYTTF